MPVIDIQGLSFNVQIDGDPGAPPLLLSNSLSSDLSMWDGQVPIWAKTHRVIRYDCRGHGRTAVPPAPYTMDQLGQDAVAVLDALGIDTADFCGLSMGGMVGMWMLTHAASRVRRAVLANTAAYMGPASLWDGRIALARAGGMAATVEPTVTRWFPPEFHASNPGAIDRMRAMIRQVPLEGYIGCCMAIRDMDQRDSIRVVTNPTLILIGTKDPATTPADGELIHGAIVGSSRGLLDAGHLSNIQHPALFTDYASQFFAK